MNKHLAALAAALILAAPLAASAQDVPSYAASENADQQIHGRIANFDGAYNLQVRDDQGYLDNVQLHDGTIINPTGLTLAPGMVVSIDGFNSGSFFDANEIDTPYTIDAGVPFYAGHAWDYYGPSISLAFFFGSGGWWHGGGYGHGYAYDGVVRGYDRARIGNDVRVENNVRVDNVRVENVRQNGNVQGNRAGFATRQPTGFASRPSGGYAPAHAAPASRGFDGARASGGGGGHSRR